MYFVRHIVDRACAAAEKNQAAAFRDRHSGHAHPATLADSMACDHELALAHVYEPPATATLTLATEPGVHCYVRVVSAAGVVEVDGQPALSGRQDEALRALGWRRESGARWSRAGEARVVRL